METSTNEDKQITKALDDNKISTMMGDAIVSWMVPYFRNWILTTMPLVLKQLSKYCWKYLDFSEGVRTLFDGFITLLHGEDKMTSL